MGKVFKKLIRNHIVNYFGEDKNCDQHYFLKGKSTLSNISESVNTINEYLMWILYI